jgi:hypothetical protein
LRYVITKQGLLPKKKNIPNFLKMDIRIKQFHEDKNSLNNYGKT